MQDRYNRTWTKKVTKSNRCVVVPFHLSEREDSKSKGHTQAHCLGSTLVSSSCNFQQILINNWQYTKPCGYNKEQIEASFKLFISGLRQIEDGGRNSMQVNKQINFKH